MLKSIILTAGLGLVFSLPVSANESAAIGLWNLTGQTLVASCQRLPSRPLVGSCMSNLEDHWLATGQIVVTYSDVALLSEAVNHCSSTTDFDAEISATPHHAPGTLAYCIGLTYASSVQKVLKRSIQESQRVLRHNAKTF